MESIKCPACGILNFGGESQCKRCGADLRGTAPNFAGSQTGNYGAPPVPYEYPAHYSPQPPPQPVHQVAQQPAQEPLRTCPRCRMAVPASAYVCGYCKKQLRTSPVTWGCLALIVIFCGIGVLPLLLLGGTHSAPQAPAQPAVSAPAPPRTPEQAAAAKKQEAEKAKAEQLFLASPAGKVWKAHPDWDRDTCQVVADKKIRIGMSKSQVRASWGDPDRVNTTTTSYGTHEQWVYEDGSYVYFDADSMTSLQQSR